MKNYLFAHARILLLIIIVVSSIEVYAGNDDEPDVKDLSFKERLFVGGHIGLQIGDFTFIDVSPLIGYRLTNNLSAGLGLTYQYFHYRHFGYGTHTYGGNIFARYTVIPQAFIYAEYEMLNLESSYFDLDGRDRFWEYNYFLGAGYRVRLGRKAYFNLMLLYNFNKDSYIYFDDWVFRFSIEVGL